MKITSLETLCLSRMHEPAEQWITGSGRTIKADCALVVVHTDEGVSGIGEACPYGIPHLIRDWVAWLSAKLIGRTVREAATQLHPNGRIADYNLVPFINPHDAAIAGIDTALWDLRAKLAGVPLCELLRPGAPQQIELYASSGCRYDWRDPEQLITETLGYRDAGYTACKVRIGTEWRWDNVTTERFLELMTELRTAVGARMRLMVDGNKRLSVEQAFVMAKGLDQLGFAWFEEPFPYEEIDAYARLSAMVEMPISGGEQFTTLEQFRPYFEKRCFKIVQPDVACSGITEALHIAEMAERYDVPVIPHNWHHGLMTMANAHYVAALPRPHSLELCMIQGPLQWAIVAEPPQIKAGGLTIPKHPGLGVELASDLAARFPYIEGHYAVMNLR
ncbi:MAG: mandelate racemase/muconate lactonizing enzyme family protein [Roseiflexaceae bacterium]|nr:mandelate racemase/muconate lactonizing enzyme family protein [Roseiflexaceae bacterium]